MSVLTGTCTRELAGRRIDWLTLSASAFSGIGDLVFPDALAKVADGLGNVQGKIIRVEGHKEDVPTAKGLYRTN